MLAGMVILALFARSGVRSFDAAGRIGLPEPWLTLFTWPFTPKQEYRKGVSIFIFAQQIATLFAVTYVLYPERSLRVFWALVLAGYGLGGTLALFLYKHYPAPAPPRFITRFQPAHPVPLIQVKTILAQVIGVSEDRVEISSFKTPIEAWDFLDYPIQLLKDDDKPIYGIRFGAKLDLYEHRARVMQGLSNALGQTLYVPVTRYLLPGVGAFMHQPDTVPQVVYLGIEDINDTQPVDIDTTVILEAVYSVGHTASFVSVFGSMGIYFSLGFLLLRTSELWGSVVFMLAFPSMFVLSSILLSTWYRWAIDRGTDPEKLQQRMVPSLAMKTNPKRWAHAGALIYSGPSVT